MANILTRIKLPGQRVWPGLLEWDRKSPREMIASARRYSAHLRAQADIIDAATDYAFQIDVVRGSAVQHHVAEVQKAANCTTCGDLGFIPPQQRMGETTDCPDCAA